MRMTTLGGSSLQVPRLGVGAMTWGEARGLARLQPAKIAYGGAHGHDEEKAAFPSRLVSIPRLMDLMADAVQAGKIKAIGVSNYSAKEMRVAHAALARRGVPLASNQVEYSLLHRQPEVDGVLDACRELSVTLIAYRPLASGALTGKYVAGVRPSGLRRFMPNFRSQALDALVPVVGLPREIGERYGKNPAQVALRWLIENETVVPIPGARNRRQAADNAGAVEFKLTADEIAALDQITRAWRA